MCLNHFEPPIAFINSPCLALGHLGLGPCRDQALLSQAAGPTTALALGDAWLGWWPQNVPFKRLKGVPKNGCLPSGKLLHNYGKSLCWMGTSAIPMAIFNSYAKFPEGIWTNGWRKTHRKPLFLSLNVEYGFTQIFRLNFKPIHWFKSGMWWLMKNIDLPTGSWGRPYFQSHMVGMTSEHER